MLLKVCLILNLEKNRENEENERSGFTERQFVYQETEFYHSSMDIDILISYIIIRIGTITSRY